MATALPAGLADHHGQSLARSGALSSGVHLTPAPAPKVQHQLLMGAIRSAGHAGLLASIVAIGGLVCLFVWVAWRFGPTITRFCGIASWWAAWACGSQGGYDYMVVLLILGTGSWAFGTLWYAKRRGHWPSPLSQRIFTRTLATQHTKPGTPPARPDAGATAHPEVPRSATSRRGGPQPKA
jgi:hypothetical protein